MIIVTGTVRAKPGTFEALKAECIAHSVRSRGEPGCISHNVHVDCEDPLRLFFYEMWEDMDALRLHGTVPGSHALVAFLREHAAERPTMEIYDSDEIKLG